MFHTVSLRSWGFFWYRFLESVPRSLRQRSATTCKHLGSLSSLCFASRCVSTTTNASCRSRNQSTRCRSMTVWVMLTRYLSNASYRPNLWSKICCINSKHSPCRGLSFSVLQFWRRCEGELCSRRGWAAAFCCGGNERGRSSQRHKVTKIHKLTMQWTVYCKLMSCK